MHILVDNICLILSAKLFSPVNAFLLFNFKEKKKHELVKALPLQVVSTLVYLWLMVSLFSLTLPKRLKGLNLKWAEWKIICTHCPHPYIQGGWEKVYPDSRETPPTVRMHRPAMTCIAWNNERLLSNKAVEQKTICNGSKFAQSLLNWSNISINAWPAYIYFLLAITSKLKNKPSFSNTTV